jgi:hypothetical protein
MAIRVQAEDFDIGAELAALTDGDVTIGGVTSFVGLVREMGSGPSAMTLEHYPGMTEPAPGVADRPPLWTAGTGRQDRAGRDRQQTPGSGLRELPFSDRLAEDQGTILEA